MRVYPQPVELMMSESALLRFQTRVVDCTPQVQIAGACIPAPFCSRGNILTTVYQKVCPPPVFALFLEIVELSGALPGVGGGPGGGQGQIPIPSGPGASVADIDDGSSSANGSGGDWDRVSQ